MEQNHNLNSFLAPSVGSLSWYYSWCNSQRKWLNKSEQDKTFETHRETENVETG
jgi:hypothetical protein